MSEPALQEREDQVVESNETANEQSTARQNHFYRPNADIVELADAYRVALDVPGSTAEGVDIQFADGVLNVTASVPSRQEPGKKFLLREYGVADYRRSFQLGDKVDVQNIRADYADGVLTLHMPKVPEAQPRRISVHVG